MEAVAAAAAEVAAADPTPSRLHHGRIAGVVPAFTTPERPVSFRPSPPTPERPVSFQPLPPLSGRCRSSPYRF
ncbi:hypothetical protein GCM10022248_91900 [Nonomuraea soli]